MRKAPLAPGGSGLRVLELNPYLTDRRGGLERRIFGLSRELVRRGHEVTAVTGLVGDAPVESVEGGVRVLRLDASFFDAAPYDPPFLSQKGFSEALKGAKPEVVDIHYMWTPDYTRSLRRVAHGARIVFTFHNSFGWGEGVDGRAAYISGSVLKFFARNCDAAVCASDFIRRDVRAQGVDAERLSVVPNGIDATSDADLAALRKAPGRHERPYAIFAGRIERTKGLALLVDAARDIKAPLDFVILGKGPDQEGLEAQARETGVGARFHFLGFVEEARKRQLIAQADLFVYPASFEPTGLATLEAMDLGCPVVATSVGGIPEIVGEAGRFVAPGDPDALGRAIDELYQVPEERARLSKLGRTRSAAFAWPKVAAMMEAAFAAPKSA